MHSPLIAVASVYLFGTIIVVLGYVSSWTDEPWDVTPERVAFAIAFAVLWPLALVVWVGALAGMAAYLRLTR